MQEFEHKFGQEPEKRTDQLRTAGLKPSGLPIRDLDQKLKTYMENFKPLTPVLQSVESQI